LKCIWNAWGFRAIGRILKISYVTVFQWIKKWGENLELPKRNESIKIVELNELHTYYYFFGCKNNKKIYTKLTIPKIAGLFFIKN
jgi:hypothetical protein